jgi:hypothetical protein
MGRRQTHPKRSDEREIKPYHDYRRPETEKMIPVAIMAELVKEYTAAVARALECVLSAAPRGILPRRVRFLVLRSLHFILC